MNRIAVRTTQRQEWTVVVVSVENHDDNESTNSELTWVSVRVEECPEGFIPGASFSEISVRPGQFIERHNRGRCLYKTHKSVLKTTNTMTTKNDRARRAC